MSRSLRRFAVALFALILPVAVWAQSESLLMVQGTGNVTIVPDRATIRLGVTARAETASEAQSEVNRISGAILEALRRAGTEDRAIRTERLFLYPISAPLRDADASGARIIGYHATNSIAVEVDDTDVIGIVIDAGLAAGANEISGVTFGLKDDTEAYESALGQAIGQARRKAAVMAEALGVRIVRIASVQEAGVYFGQPFGGGFASSAEVSVAADGPMDVVASVRVDFEVSED
jgi:uncharacterized protein YggE